MHSAGDNLRPAGFNLPVSPPPRRDTNVLGLRAARWEKTEQAVPIVTQNPEHAVGIIDAHRRRSLSCVESNH